MANTIELKQQIAQGEYDAAFAKLYGADAVQEQRKRYTDLIDEFEKKYGTNRTVRLYSAPGRTEIGGNHTDHNNGVVLAGSVNLDMVAVVSPNKENVIRVKSLGFDKIDDVDVTNLVPQPREAEHSASLIRGVAKGIVDAGGKVGGFDCYTTSNVLRGSGLSSSAAFEVCIGAILRGEYNNNDMEKFNQVKIAQIGQYAENVFFGKPCGLMDQTACAVGGVITIDFKDPAHPMVGQTAIDLAKRKGEKWWLLLLFSLVSIALGVLLIWHPFGAAVSVVMLCGVLLIVEGALNLGCILYAAMELRTLDRMANAAVNATLTALGDALDEAEAAGTDIVDVTSDGEPVVYDAESTDVSDEGPDKT
mgnify:CR=1 FL=1